MQNEETQRKLAEVLEGDLDISLREFMELSLMAFFTGNELQQETPVLYKGAWWKLYLCVSHVAPAEQIKNLRNKQ